MRMESEIKDLYASVVLENAKHFDFSEGYGEKWEIALDLTEEEQENEEYFPMNYIYPLPPEFERDMEERFGEDWRRKIKEKLVCMTVVYIIDEDRYYLALTGAGMDFSWEICETYINLGYLPPIEFCDLPNLAGKDYSKPENKRIVLACLRSVELAEARISSIKSKLEAFLR